MSVDAAGAEANASSQGAAISSDGRYILFESTASNLVANDTNGGVDVFLRDRVAGTTTAISTDLAGVPVGGRAPAMSSDARFIVFQSPATGLTQAGIPDTNGTDDVFLLDRQSGIRKLVSTTLSGTAAGNGASRSPSVSADGRFVAFESDATNLALSDNPGVTDIFVADLSLGQSFLASINSSSNPPANSLHPAISASGHFVAFASDCGLLTGDTNTFRDIYVEDVFVFSLVLVSAPLSPLSALGDSDFPSISADGSTVAFESSSAAFGFTDTNGVKDIYMRNWNLSVNKLISIRPNGAQFSIPSLRPSLSDNAHFVSFHSVPAGSGTHPEMGVYVRDVLSAQTTQVSVSSSGANANGQSPALASSRAISNDAKFIAFHSAATNLTLSDTNGVVDTFVRAASTPFFTPECFGDGSAGTIPCPCNNNGAAGHGCDNSFGTGGGLLVASGSPVLSADDLTLTVTGLPPATTALFVQNDVLGAPVLSGDGISCPGGTLIRLGENPTTAGTASFGFGVPGDPAIHVKGGIPTTLGAQTRHYAVFYRNSANFCTASTSNWSNSIAVVWLP